MEKLKSSSNTYSNEYHRNILNDLDVGMESESASSSEFSTPDDEIGYVTAPIDSIGPPGRWLRHVLLEGILFGTPVLLAIQGCRTRQMTSLMRIASFLGTEDFYAIMMCFLAWIIDMRLARLCIIAMGIGFYVANFVKNLMCLPRPPCPPIHPLEQSFCTWGLPSHHALLGVVTPWYIWFYLLMHYQYEMTTYVCIFMVICSWSFSVLFSRMYLGVHSPADVIVGSILGCFIVTFMLRFDNLIEKSSFMTAQGCWIVPLFAAIMLCLHPYDEIGLAAFTETLCMAGTTVGFVLGRALVIETRAQNIKALIDTEHDAGALTIIGFSLLRFAIGAVMVGATKFLMKYVFQLIAIVICQLANVKYYTKAQTSVFYTGYSEQYRLPPIQEKKKQEAEEEDELTKSSAAALSALEANKPRNISHFVRYLTYACMGIVATYVAPATFVAYGIVL